MEFDRFDIAEAYSVYSMHWNINGSTRRDVVLGRNIGVQLSRLRFRARPDLDEDTLTENGRYVYDNLVAKWEGA